MQLSDLRTAVRTRLGRPSSDSFFTDAVLTDLINEAVQAISVEALWPWLQKSDSFNTVAGTADYDTPEDWQFTKQLSISPDIVIDYKPLAELTELGADTAAQPIFYTFVSGKFRLAPVPSEVTAVTHVYYQIEPALSADADTPILPAQFHYAIVALAASLACGRAGNNQDMQQELGVYQNWLSRMNAYKRRVSGPLRPRATRDY